MTTTDILKLVLKKLAAAVLPVNGITPKYVGGVVSFLWSHLPASWVPIYAQILGVIAIFGLPLFMDHEKAFNRIMVVGMLLVISQVMIPNSWKMFRQEPHIGVLVWIGMLHFVDWAIATAGWSAMDKKE